MFGFAGAHRRICESLYSLNPSAIVKFKTHSETKPRRDLLNIYADIICTNWNIHSSAEKQTKRKKVLSQSWEKCNVGSCWLALPQPPRIVGITIRFLLFAPNYCCWDALLVAAAANTMAHKQICNPFRCACLPIAKRCLFAEGFFFSCSNAFLLF